MTKDEALKLALEALQDRSSLMKWQKAINAVEAALEAKDEPWSPVSIGVDVTKDGAHVVGIYALDKDTSQIFYTKHYPPPQRTWVGLTDEEINNVRYKRDWTAPWTDTTFARAIEAKLKEKNT
jgi:hypothetical protein